MATCISNQAVEITRKDNPGYRAIDAMNETIANIVYEYQRIVESDAAWPSAQYVQDKLRGEPFKASKEQQELYDLLGLSETKAFTSEAQRDAFVEKYLKNNGTWVFPESSVTMYRGVKGDYKLSVGLPTTKNNITSSVEAEIEYIKQRAVADGTFMKAPNGNKSNLNGRQWLQVRTRAFKEWFGDWENDPKNASKVVDENGEPLVVYHGSKDNTFTIFDRSKNDKGQKGFFFTDSEVMASSYGKNPRGFFLNSRDPYTIEGNGSNWNAIYVTTSSIAKDKLDAIRLYRNQLQLALQKGTTSKETYDFWDREYFQYLDKYNSLGNSTIDKIKRYILQRRLNTFQGEGAFIKSTRYAENILEYDTDDVSIIFKNITDYGPVFNIEAAKATVGNVPGNVYVVTNPNQIKSATDNNGEFSTEDNDVYQNIVSNTLSELEYINILDELELSEDKTSSFLDNFLNKILLVNPKDKVRRNYASFAYQRLADNTPDDFRYKLFHKIFGFETTRINKVLGAKKEAFLSDVRDQLSHWKSDLIDVINDPKLGKQSFNDILSKLYVQRNEIKENIELLQRVLDSNVSFTRDDVFDSDAMSAKLPNFTKLEINTVSRLLPLHKKTISRQAIALKLQELKRNLDSKLKEIKRTQYAKYQITLAAKNRLVAINTIPNLFDLVEKRLELEYDSQVLSEEQIDKELGSKKPLYDAIQKVIDTHKLEKQGQPLFNEKEQRECSYEELRDKILETNPEFKDLLELLRKANPKLKIKVGGDPNVNEDGSYEGGVFRMKENELVLPNIADVYSAVHELVHSGTSYGIRMQENEETDAFEKQIDTFMNYIRDYIRTEQLDQYGVFTSLGITSPDVYGFKNAAEFVAELFSNSSFQEFLSMIPPMKKKEFKSLLHEIWSNIVDFLNKLVGKKLDKSALDQAKKLGYAAMFLQQQHMSDIYRYLERIAEQEQGESLQNVIRQSDGSVDIHFTKGHNPELSNFAPRKTTIDLSNFRTLDGVKQITFPSVEHAFQYMKFIAVQQMYSRQVKDGNKTKVVWTNQSRAEELQKAAQNVLTAPNGSSAKSKGLALRLTEQEQKAWDSYSPQLMKFLLQQSFAQNKGARDLLLATGDAKLTHSVAESKKGPNWKELFPQFLTEIRESYKNNQPNSEPNNAQQTDRTDQAKPIPPEAPSIVEQIVNLLRDQGVKVYGKTNLVNFLKNKGDKNIQKYLSRKARAEFERLLLKNRPDMSKAEVNATLDFLHSLPNSKEDAAYVKTAIRWVLNDSIRLPEDHIRARQAFDEARKKRIDVSKYRTLGELIISDEMRPKEKEKKPFNPNEAKSFSNKHIVTTEGGRNYEVYDVEDNEQGLEDVCKAVSAHYSVSPWCVSTFTATGKPTESAKRMWSQYRSIPKKIAFLDGRPVAFSADSYNRNAYERGTLRDYDIQANDNGEYYIMQPADGEILLSEVQPLINEGLIEIEEDPFGMRSNLYRLTTQGKTEASFEHVGLPIENWWGLDNWITQPEINDKININPNAIGSGQQLANQEFMQEMQAELEWEWQQQLEEEARIAEQERAYWAERWVGNNVGYDPYAEIREYQNDETYDKILQNVPFITKYLRDGQLFYPYQEALRDLIRRGYDENTITETLLEDTASYIAEAEDLPFYQTEEGEIYGFVDEDNSMYLDETVITPEHPIHEFTHIWDRIVQEKQPELWKQGIELMRQIYLWDEVLNSEQYGQKWADLTEEERTNRIASEVHSRLTGKEGERILNEIAEKEGKSDIISKLKRWLKEVWMSLRETFGSTWTEQELAALTLNDFTQLTLRDLTEGTLKDFLTKQEKKSVISEETDVPVGVKELTKLKEDKEYQKDALLLNQFEKLTKEHHIPMSTIDEAAVDIANWISDQITDIIDDPSIAKQIGVNISKDEIKNMSRIDVIKKLTPNKLFEWCKKDRFLHNEDINIDDIELAQQLQHMAECWDFLMQRSLMTILENEKIAITIGDNTSAMKVTEVTDDIDIDNPADIAEQEMAEETGENQQEWGIENKTVDLLGTATAAVRDELRRCYVLDEDGDKVLTDRGVFKRIPMREALNSLQRWVEGSQKLSDAVAKLETKVDKNPWLANLISKLKDPNYEKLQSEMWQVLNAPFINYWVVVKKDGKFVTTNVNSRPALKEAMNNIQAIYSAGIHPLFTLDGVNTEHLKTLKEESDLLSGDIKNKVEALQKQGKNISEDEDLFKQAVGSIGIALNVLGYSAPAELVAENLTNEAILNTASVLSSIVWTVDRNKNNKSYNPFAYLDAKGNRNSGSIKGYLNQLLSPLTESLEDTAITCFYDNGKMYQSRVKPSFLTLQMQNFHLQGEEFKEFIRQNYAELPWFRDQDESFEVDWTKGWRNPLLERLITNQDARDHFRHKVQLNFNKKQYMKGMNPSQYIMSSITEFVAGMETSDKGLTYSYIRIPIQSNKPSSEYIMMEVFTGSTYQDDITYRLKMIFDQEMSRISTVRKRNYERGKDDGYIDGFDSVGRKFCFLDFMNYFLDTTEGKNSELGKLLERKLDGKKETQLTPDEESTFLDLVTKEIKGRMNSRIEQILAEWDREGITKSAENISKIGPTDQIRETLKKFLWNDSLGAMNIMELFVGDIAFYEDADTLQKRLAELHAPGIRPNTEVKYQGENITDGKLRSVQLSDFELDAKELKTNILENVKTVFERKIAEAPESEKQAWRDLLDHLTNEKTGLFVTDINVTDGQAFNCPTSYMKKAKMYGKWGDAQEAVLQKIRKGEKYTWADVKRAFNTPTFATTKPTVYGNAVVDTGVKESGALDKISVPTYFKNSEYTIMLADAILQGEDTGRPNMLRAIFNVMEQSHWRKDANGEDVYQNDGIDTIQFISAVKSGVGKTVDLVQFLNNPNGEKLAEEYLKQQIYLDPTNNKIPNSKNYNLHTVRELPFESYAIQMDVANHFLEHEQIHGSQNRMIIPSELAETDAEGNVVYYDTPQGKKTAKEFGEIYEKTIAANIQQSIKELQDMLGLPVDGSNESQLSSQSTLKKNLAISKILKREIMSNPRYGLDLYFACSIDPETGGFRIPLGDPVQSKRIEQLLNSVIKNKINKQKIAGGPVVQVTNFGTSKNLNIRFKNKNKPGELLMTRNEFFEKNNTTSDEAYKDYVDKNQGGIAHFEVYAAASTKKLFEHFADKDGNIDIGAIEMVNPDLLKMIGYRIPTEAKYSITPMKIVGFLPREAGEAIMMPYEITLLNGSDFDVDKMYLMSKVFDIEKAGEFYDFELTEPNWKAEKRLANQINEFLSGTLNTSLENSNGEVTVETINRFMSRHKNWQGYQEDLKKYGEVKKARREAWNQVVLDMMNAAKGIYKLSDAQRNLINQTVDSRKELTAEQKEQDKKDLISKITDKTLRDKAVAFLKGGYRENSHNDDAITREFRKVFLKALYRTKDPMDAKKLRDNQIIDMSWSVLTHETTAHELLNPGGFDPQKKMGYVMAILKDPANGGKYDYHDLMKNYSLKDLRKLASSNTSLMFFDGQAKYYRQNSAAGSLTGIFAVHRTAHAVLERDNLHIHLAGLLGSKRNPFKSFNIAGVDFTDYMRIDTRFDRLGNSIGKILGSLVAAAVDAGKYPVLNLSNINNETANVCVSMIKLGMTFEDTALFLSQKVIDDLLARHNAENIDGYKSLQSLINEELKELEKSSKIDKTSPLWSDDLTEEALIDGLLDTTIEHKYRVLSALKKMLKVADAMRLPTAATRYNSISSAVGPQIINNIIAEKKIQKMNSKSFIYTEEAKYNNDPALSVEDIVNLHPVLQQFYRANSIAKQVFKGMPASSNGFNHVIDAVVAKGLDDTMFNDTKLMSGLSDFYQTYLLYKTGVVRHSELHHYINEFPTEFITKKMKDKHPNNKLVQAISYNKDKAGRIILEITTTGMDQSAKSPLMSAWWDLYNTDKKLAIDLFKYCIYRGGVGFSPKTFMNLVPVFLKEVIPGYTDTYNKLPQLDTGEPGRETSEPQRILDMFVQNNYNNGKLVKNMTKEFNQDKNLYLTQEKGFTGVMEYSPSDYEKFTDVPYFRLNDKIYKQVYNDKMYHVLKYIELPILGNDRNYVEVLVSNEKPVVSRVEATTDFDNFDIREDSDIIEPNNTFDTADAVTTDSTEDIQTILEKQRDTPTAIDLFIDAMGDPNIGASRYIAWKQAPRRTKDINREKLDKFFTERLRIRGIQANKELLDELFKQLC